MAPSGTRLRKMSLPSASIEDVYNTIYATQNFAFNAWQNGALEYRAGETLSGAATRSQAHAATCSVACLAPASMLIYEVASRCQTGDVILLVERDRRSPNATIQAVRQRAARIGESGVRFSHDDINHVCVVWRDRASSAPILLERRSNGHLYWCHLLDRLRCDGDMILAFYRPLRREIDIATRRKFAHFVRSRRWTEPVNARVPRGCVPGTVHSVQFLLKALQVLGVDRHDIADEDQPKKPTDCASLCFPALPVHWRAHHIAFMTDTL